MRHSASTCLLRAERRIIEWEARRQTLVAKREDEGGQVVYRFDIRLQGEGETVFFDV